jgi:hypothetical protein
MIGQTLGHYRIDATLGVDASRKLPLVQREQSCAPVRITRPGIRDSFVTDIARTRWQNLLAFFPQEPEAFLRVKTLVGAAAPALSKPDADTHSARKCSGTNSLPLHREDRSSSISTNQPNTASRDVLVTMPYKSRPLAQNDTGRPRSSFRSDRSVALEEEIISRLPVTWRVAPKRSS